MKDYIGRSKFINRPLANPIQSVFRRFVKTPGTGLPDYLEDSRKKFTEFGNNTLRTRFTDMMEEGSD
jgi:hypothetical protein